MTHIQMHPADSVARRAFVNALNNAYADYFIPIFVSVSFLRDMVVRESLRLDQSVAAVSGRDVVGTGLLGVREKRGWVGGMGVVPDYRQQGIGRRMMHYLMERAAELGLGRVQLEVIAENAPAIALYESLGFTTRRRLYVMIGDGGLATASTPDLRTDERRGPVDPGLLAMLPHAPLPWQRDLHVMASYRRQLHTLTLSDGGQPVAACVYVAQGVGLQLMYAAAVDALTGATLFDALYQHNPGSRVTYLNVGEDDPLLPVLYEKGFTVGVEQFEMTFDIE